MAQEQTQAPKSFRILVVDDDEQVLTLFQKLLGETQQVDVARDGPEALEKAKEHTYGLIFLDVRLPGEMNGVATLDRLRELQPDAIVVMMSGYSVEDEIRRAMEMGAMDFLRKPFEDLGEIMTIEEVARYLSLHELTVRRLAREGEIPAFKVGRQWRI
ncbi:MAG: response regulator, partial [Anaerolineae bacterium]|nr:response regulator [Anaerolineae bacterium]